MVTELNHGRFCQWESGVEGVVAAPYQSLCFPTKTVLLGLFLSLERGPGYAKEVSHSPSVAVLLQWRATEKRHVATKLSAYF